MKFPGKLLAYSSAAATFLLINKADAQVIYQNIDPDILLEDDDTFSLDFNDDTFPDITFNLNYFQSTTADSYFCNSDGELNIKIQDFYGVRTGGYWPGASVGSPFNYGSEINDGLAWVAESNLLLLYANHSGFGCQGLGHSYFFNPDWNGSNKFLGLQILIDGNIHFGWVRLSIEKKDSEEYLPRLIIQDFAINMNIGESIEINLPNAPVATNIILSDSAETNTPSDLHLSFTKADEELKISAYRVFIFPSDSIIPTIPVLESLGSEYYVELLPDGSDKSLYFSDSSLDVYGNIITEGIPYKAIVLSIADGILVTAANVSIPSNSELIKLRSVGYLRGGDFYNNTAISDITGITVTFYAQFDEFNVSEYRVIIANDLYISTDSLLNIPEPYYQSVPPDATVGYSINPEADVLVYNDEVPKLFHRYEAYVLAVPDYNSASIATSTNWFFPLVFCYEPYPVAPEVYLNPGSTQSGEIRVTLPIFYDETVLEQYRFYIVKSSTSLHADDLNEISSGWSYTNVYVNGTDLDLYLDENMKDWQGNAIDFDTEYYIIVGYYGNARTVSLPSAPFTFNGGNLAVEAEIIHPIISNTNNALQIQFDKPLNFKVELFTMDGKRVAMDEGNTNFYSSSFAHLPAGLYQVIITSDENMYNAQLIIAH